MEPDDIQAALASAVEEVLETMCFTGVVDSSEQAFPPAEPPAEGAGAPGDGRVITAELNFEGNPSGAFRVGVPSGLARMAAAGFLGREESEVSDLESGEMICELANMFCGAALSRLESESTFHLFHPELTERDAPSGATRWFDLGDGMILTASLELQTDS